MGVVYHARDGLLGREVALKRLSPRLLGSQAGIQRFLAEARAIAALAHPHIVQIYQFGEDGQGPFIAMEWIEGQDLRSLLKQRGKLSPGETLALIRPILEALDYAHRKGVVHRDLKPANILLTADGVPKVADFGLARIVTTEDLTLSGESVGTLAYMAPEQVGDAKHADHRADIFALAKIFYQMLTGEHPGTVDLQLLPNEMRDILLRALRTKPEDRYFSIREFREALEGAVSKPVDREPDRRPRPQPTRRRRWAWAMAVTLTAVVGIVLAVVYLPSLWGRGGNQWNAPTGQVSPREHGPDPMETERPPAETAPAEGADRPGAVSEGEPAATADQGVSRSLSGSAPPTGVPSAGESHTFTIYPVVEMDFVWIPAGRFRMGSPNGEPERYNDEGPVHDVEITQGFWLGKYEVTQAQWQAVMEGNPSSFKGDTRRLVVVEDDPSSFKGDTRRLVVKASWEDCQAFTKKLNQSAGEEIYRLPTEAEWEYACRAGTRTARYWGDGLENACRYANLADLAWERGRHSRSMIHECNDGYAETAPVGEFKANAWGLFDMIGNVWEWCQDWYGSDYYAVSPGQDPRGPGTGSGRVMRGGCYYNEARHIRSARRIGATKGTGGLRLARTAS
ncbi:MAG: SUMF1/EgtB/PvdO family nonheme iron enzyme [Candidatus Eisenbacteria sp.]|nr:SUMF1/EgtB/PvdO family nonheme iron enzyme [Candidatus Eisenbacteria bacterium]